MNTLITAGNLQYCNLTGSLTYIKSIGRCKKGQPAGSTVTVDGKQYGRITVDGQQYPTHKYIWFMVTKEMPEWDKKIRFMDGDSLNFAANNLTYGQGRLSTRIKDRSVIPDSFMLDINVRRYTVTGMLDGVRFNYSTKSIAESIAVVQAVLLSVSK